MRKLPVLFLSLIVGLAAAQTNTKKATSVLFIGNSYVYFNDLPDMLTKIAASTGDKITWDSSTPGGYTFFQHTTHLSTLTKLKQPWDYVILQEQSQLPSGPISEVRAKVYPNARILDSLAHLANPKSNVIFYMTWGRKNGDKDRCVKIPEVCTYRGMDSLMNARYTEMAKANHAMIAPVSAVWKYLRENNPAIELYNADGSHPSEAGSYAAACSFYSVILKKDPTLIKYDSKLTATEAEAIRLATKKVLSGYKLSWIIR